MRYQFIDKPSQEGKGIFFFLLGLFLLTINIVIVKVLDDEISLPVFIFFMHALGTIIFLPTLFKQKEKITAKSFLLYFLCLFCGFLSYLCLLLASSHLTLVDALSLANTSVFFLPFILLIFFKESIEKKAWLGVIFSIFGILGIMKIDTGLLNIWALVALLAGFLFAFTWAFFAFTHQLKKPVFLFYYFLIGSVFSFPFAWIYWQMPKKTLWLLMIGNSLILILFKYFFTKAFNFFKISKIISFNYFTIIYALILDWLLWDEIPGLTALIAICLLVLGGCVISKHLKLEK